MKTYYEILEINKDATPKEIKKAFYSLAKKYHPDTTPFDKEYGQEKFKEIEHAYKILLNPQTKAAYDNSLKNIYEEQERLRKEAEAKEQQRKQEEAEEQERQRRQADIKEQERQRKLWEQRVEEERKRYHKEEFARQRREWEEIQRQRKQEASTNSAIKIFLYQLLDVIKNNWKSILVIIILFIFLLIHDEVKRYDYGPVYMPYYLPK